jgi:hypothetical protein
MAERAFPDSTVRHGSYSGWSLHQKLGQDPCDACYRAKSEYDKRRRAVPRRVQMNRMHAAAQGLAERDLRRAHPQEYAELYEHHKAEILKRWIEEKRKEGDG